MQKNRADLLALLDSFGFSTSTVDHPPLFTVDESQALRGEIAGAHTKNLFVKDKKGRIFLVVAEENRAIDLKSLHKAIGAQGRLSFASAERMRALLGVEPGSVTALGLVNDTEGAVTLVLDRGLLAHDMINCHPLTNEATTTIRRDDLLDFFERTGHSPLLATLDGGGETEDNGRAG